MKKYINNEKFRNVIFSILGTFGIAFQYRMGNNNIISNSILDIIVLVLLLFFYKKKVILNKCEKIFSIAFSILLSFIMVIGFQLDTYGFINWSIITIIRIFLLIFAFLPLFKFLYYIVNKLKEKYDIKLTKKKKIIVFSIILFFNLLVLLALYPGVYGYDGCYQIAGFLKSDYQLTTHYSIIYSFFLAKCVQFGQVVFKSNEVGFAFYAFIQTVIMSYIATRVSIFSYNLSKNKYVLLLSIIFFSLFPLYTIMVVSSAQDTLFAGIFALLIINIIEHGESIKPVKFIIKISILAFLLCAIRNNGMYALLFVVVVALLFNKGKRVLSAIPLIIGIVLNLIFTGPIYNYLNIEKESPIIEMSSIPGQQLARVYNYNYLVLNKDDLKQYDYYYYDLDRLSIYKTEPLISDNIKRNLDIDNTSKDLSGYLKLWIKIGTKDVKNYSEAFLLTNLGVWYPGKYYYDNRMYHPYIEYKMINVDKNDPRYELIERDSKFPLYDKLLSVLVEENKWQKLPVISVVFSIGSYLLLYLFVFSLCIIRKQRKYIVILSMYAGLYITIFLAPVALYRYTFPVVITLPILVSIIFDKKKQNQE